MIHYTINTGHSRRSPQSEVREDVISIMKPLTSKGKHVLPIHGYTLEVASSGRGFFGTVYRSAREPIVSIGVAADAIDASEIWPAMESLYFRITDQGVHAKLDWEVPRQPTEYPWCSVLLTALLKNEHAWIGDFESCLAWAYLASRFE